MLHLFSLYCIAFEGDKHGQLPVFSGYSDMILQWNLKPSITRCERKISTFVIVEKALVHPRHHIYISANPLWGLHEITHVFMTSTLSQTLLTVLWWSRTTIASLWSVSKVLSFWKFQAMIRKKCPNLCHFLRLCVEHQVKNTTEHVGSWV